MKSNLKILLIVILLSFPFYLGASYIQRSLDNIIFAREITENPPLFLLAEIEKKYSLIPKPELSAENALSIEIKGKEERIIFQKNHLQSVKIASLIKLLTAVTAEEFYKLEDKVTISPKAVSQYQDRGNLKAGERIILEKILEIMLVESSNDAAFAVAEITGVHPFAALMNIKAKEIGMENTFIFEPTGLDPEDRKFGEKKANLSTAYDLYLLSKHILLENPLFSLVKKTSKEELPLFLENGNFHHLIKNTNQLVAEIPETVLSKTGYTGEAGGCLIMALECSKPERYLINIILNSQNRNEDMKQLINYANSKCKCY